MALVPSSSSAHDEESVHIHAKRISDKISLIIQNLINRRAQSDTRDIKCLACSSEVRQHHVTIRAIDINEKVRSYLDMHGIRTSKTEYDYTRLSDQDYYEHVLSKIVKNLQKLSKINGFGFPDPSPSENYPDLAQTFIHFDRLETLLEKMGAPKMLPANVLQRILNVSLLAERLCAEKHCRDIERLPINQGEVKIPADAFVEGLLLANTMANLTQIKNLPLTVLAPPKPSSIVTPSTVFRLSGLIYSDLLEIAKTMGIKDLSRTPQVISKASPSLVWRELNYIRRLIAHIH